MPLQIRIEDLADIAIAQLRMQQEAQRWENIGRLLREFHKGDIVFHPDFGYGEVVIEPASTIIQVEWVTMGNAFQQGCTEKKLELVTPFASRFDWIS